MARHLKIGLHGLDPAVEVLHPVLDIQGFFWTVALFILHLGGVLVPVLRLFFFNHDLLGGRSLLRVVHLVHEVVGCLLPLLGVPADLYLHRVDAVLGRLLIVDVLQFVASHPVVLDHQVFEIFEFVQHLQVGVVAGGVILQGMLVASVVVLPDGHLLRQGGPGCLQVYQTSYYLPLRASLVLAVLDQLIR